ncbi:MAG TPA: hydroxymethylglutaryl-CoA reductase, degradative [Anaerolineales bacterium]|nr:hydroxymethylglutaryl-CoA reductase, degradative [Anaerolineales bacterium]
MTDSRLAGFYNLDLAQRQARLSASTGLDLAPIFGSDGLSAAQADAMIENVVGVFGLPLGIAANFVVNGKDVLVPMAIEEASVVAGASHMAKLVRESGGFRAEADPSHMIGQIQLVDLADPAAAERALLAAESEILTACNLANPRLVELGGGSRGIEVRRLEPSSSPPMLVVHLIYDTVDSMGANSVNTVLESVAPMIEAISGGRAHLRILSNLADRRLARASCAIPPQRLRSEQYDGEQVRDGIIEAWAFAAADPYRAATHNKGIMNGIDAVVIATGNDWRAVEAGAHAFAARSGRYAPLSRWSTDDQGQLVGELELPLALGTVGGATRSHPAAQACLALMQARSARELAGIVAAVGLAQNLAALRALATDGIQRGHMGLHARQLAMSAGASGPQIEQIARRMVEEGVIALERAQELMQTSSGS